MIDTRKRFCLKQTAILRCHVTTKLKVKQFKISRKLCAKLIWSREIKCTKNSVDPANAELFVSRKVLKFRPLDCLFILYVTVTTGWLPKRGQHIFKSSTSTSHVSKVVSAKRRLLSGKLLGLLLHNIQTS